MNLVEAELAVVAKSKVTDLVIPLIVKSAVTVNTLADFTATFLKTNLAVGNLSVPKKSK